ncbi:hypothetical protein EJ02DRAFT_516153 [Clathrospora elynae]|uniref:Protein kinase domain-containing protein n=1 Tax=Clathrospora elynae TaxID=706981 RepID=A0A6A5S8N5_9PLEO|nr:hypothetical protein EJ02DRAFT_516153 [Clathrospora elynae]
MGRPFLNSIPHTSRTLHQFRYRVAIVLFIFALFHQQHLYLVSRQSLTAKYAPTNFNFHTEELDLGSSRSNKEDLQFQDELIANRPAWKVLSVGWEGKVFTYNDWVIKTFTPGWSPFRNCIHGAIAKWPTEIPASLHFGGRVSNVDVSERNSSHHTTVMYNGFVPVKAYFMTSASPSVPEQWHLVTPLLGGGNLHTLAKQLSRSAEAKSFREVDARYRPAFNRLLDTMEALHVAGYCHDDIKPANIFAQDELHWVLGDLGNLRHVLHPYHSSGLWKDNEQLEDCRSNDVIRVLRSYLKFVQSSASDADRFNIAFMEGQGPGSRLFWWAIAYAPTMSAGQLHRRSLIEYPEATRKTYFEDEYPGPTRPSALISFFSRRLAVKRAVNMALVTRMGEMRARWWAMVWLFGVPNSELCGH